MRTNVNYSYFKSNLLLLIRKIFNYFQLIYILLCILLYYIFLHNSLTLFLCINKHSFIHSLNNVHIYLHCTYSIIISIPNVS